MLVDVQIRNIHALMSFNETNYRCFNPLTFTHTFYHICLCPSSLTFSPKCSAFLNWSNLNGEACKVLFTFNLSVKNFDKITPRCTAEMTREQTKCYSQ